MLNSSHGSVEEIETAIDGLPPEDYSRLVAWLPAREQPRCDEQPDRDSSTGKLDFPFIEAEDESVSRVLREWPPRT